MKNCILKAQLFTCKVFSNTLQVMCNIVIHKKYLKKIRSIFLRQFSKLTFYSNNNDATSAHGKTASGWQQSRDFFPQQEQGFSTTTKQPIWQMN
jgi:hypothetical protein